MKNPIKFVLDLNSNQKPAETIITPIYLQVTQIPINLTLHKHNEHYNLIKLIIWMQYILKF